MNKYVYIGAFIDREEFKESIAHLNKTHLYRLIENPHVTFQYKPEHVNERLFGEPLRIRVVGYGIDQENEGLKVEILIENQEIRELYEKIAVPHITISVSRDGESVNTCNLTFEPIDPFELKARFGGFINKNTIVKDRVN